MNNKNNIILVCLLILCMFVVGCIGQEHHIEDESKYIKNTYTCSNETIIICTNSYKIYIGNISDIKYNNCGNSNMDTIIFNDNIIVNAYKLEYFPIKKNGINIIKISNRNHNVCDTKILN